MPRISAERLIGGHHGISREAYRFSQGHANAFSAGIATGLQRLRVKFQGPVLAVKGRF